MTSSTVREIVTFCRHSHLGKLRAPQDLLVALFGVSVKTGSHAPTPPQELPDHFRNDIDPLWMRFVRLSDRYPSAGDHDHAPVLIRQAVAQVQHPRPVRPVKRTAERHEAKVTADHLEQILAASLNEGHSSSHPFALGGTLSLGQHLTVGVDGQDRNSSFSQRDRDLTRTSTHVDDTCTCGKVIGAYEMVEEIRRIGRPIPSIVPRGSSKGSRGVVAHGCRETPPGGTRPRATFPHRAVIQASWCSVFQEGLMAASARSASGVCERAAAVWPGAGPR